ncbi:cytochrome P450 family protein [Actinokineospora sp.]|uniref:cytochrome P450 family protein n=1 Tax=Actinokineospora sp. TaxID=1872133 RepID=UPI004038379D
MSEIDLRSDTFQTNPYPSYALLRQDSPVHYIEGPMGLGSWLITRYADARAALADPRLSKDVRRAPDWLRSMGAGAADEGPLGANMLNSDPPDHTRHRRLVSKAFTRNRMEGLRPRVQEITDELLDAVSDTDTVDLMAALAVPLPITVICELLGIPVRDRADFRTWTRMALTPPMSEEAINTRKQGNAAMEAYLSDLIAGIRSEVDDQLDYDSQPDLLSALIVASEDQDRLSERELLGTVKLLLVAGQNTVNLIGNGMLALLRHPEQLALLRERPDLLPSAVEELMRYDGPIERATPRFTVEDVEIAGVTIPKGNTVFVVIGAANHDLDYFDDPTRLDITRTNNQHLAFGGGIHFCLGAPLARVEGQVAFGTLVSRFPAIKLVGEPAELRWVGRGANIIRGVETLPVAI